MSDQNELIKLIKSQNTKSIENQCELILKEIKETEEYKETLKLLSNLEEDPYNKDNDFYFDEGSMLNASIELSLEYLEDYEPEVLEYILEDLNGIGVYLHQDQYAQNRYQFRADVCLGQPTIYNESPFDRCYAIHSEELGLEIDKVLSEEHGFALIEQAMRKAGVFDDIVSTDYHGNFSSFLSIPKEISELKDNELIELIDKLENKEEE